MIVDAVGWAIGKINRSSFHGAGGCVEGAIAIIQTNSQAVIHQSK